MNAVEIILALVAIGAIVAMILFAQKNARLVESLSRKIDDENRRTQDKIDNMNERVSEKIERNNKDMSDSLRHQLAQSTQQMNDSRKTIAEISKHLANVTETNRHVENVAGELKTLQAVLQNPKQRGVFGEYYLDTVLGNVLPVGSYDLQYKFKDGEIVDAVVFLDKGKILPIDSKFSLENYNRMVAATTKTERESLAKKVREDLKGRIDETSKYIRPAEKTMDFAFMFIPSESLYYDLLISKVGTNASERDLIEYAYRDKKVIIVSPTSFMAYLQTILQGLRSLEIEKDTKEIQARVAKLSTHINTFDTYMNKLGGSLTTTVNHFNNAYKSLSQVDKDVVKITSGEANIEAKSVARPEMEE